MILTSNPAACSACRLPMRRHGMRANCLHSGIEYGLPLLRGILCANLPMAWGAQCGLSVNVSSKMRQNINTEYVKCRPPTYVAYRSPTRRFGAKEPPTLRHRIRIYLQRAVCDKGYPLAWGIAQRFFYFVYAEPAFCFSQHGLFLIKSRDVFLCIKYFRFRS